jgi:hypothetical protein
VIITYKQKIRSLNTVFRRVSKFHKVVTQTSFVTPPPQWLYSRYLQLGRFFSFLIYKQKVGLLGRGNSPL